MKLRKILDYQQTIILIVGYLLILALGFGLGEIASIKQTPPKVLVEEAFLPPNNSENLTPAQSSPAAETNTKLPLAIISQTGECDGKIKGNIGSGNDRVYHVPNGSFYKRVVAEVCFSTEAEAITAGFRKSSR